MALERPKIEELINKDKHHLCDKKDKPCVQIVAVADLPSRYGDFQIVAFYNDKDKKDHVALVHGDICEECDVPVRLHSECLTGDAFGSIRCDCRDQLVASMKKVVSLGSGIILYLRQEGRGIGLANKMKAYQLQDFGLDTVEANVALGFEADERDYGIAAHMLESLKVKSIQLMTNNPNKIEDLQRHGIEVTGRIPVVIEPTEHSERYLKTKKEKQGHMLDDLFVE